LLYMMEYISTLHFNHGVDCWNSVDAYWGILWVIFSYCLGASID
jgi:hypothetical protein